MPYPPTNLDFCLAVHKTKEGYRTSIRSEPYPDQSYQTDMGGLFVLYCVFTENQKHSGFSKSANLPCEVWLHCLSFLLEFTPLLYIPPVSFSESPVISPAAVRKLEDIKNHFNNERGGVWIDYKFRTEEGVISDHLVVPHECSIPISAFGLLPADIKLIKKAFFKEGDFIDGSSTGFIGWMLRVSLESFQQQQQWENPQDNLSLLAESHCRHSNRFFNYTLGYYTFELNNLVDAVWNADLPLVKYILCNSKDPEKLLTTPAEIIVDGYPDFKRRGSALEFALQAGDTDTGYDRILLFSLQPNIKDFKNGRTLILCKDATHLTAYYSKYYKIHSTSLLNIDAENILSQIEHEDKEIHDLATMKLIISSFDLETGMLELMVKFISDEKFKEKFESVFGENFQAFEAQQKKDAEILLDDIEECFDTSNHTPPVVRERLTAFPTTHTPRKPFPWTWEGIPSKLQGQIKALHIALEKYVEKNAVHNDYLLLKAFEIIERHMKDAHPRSEMNCWDFNHTWRYTTFIIGFIQQLTKKTSSFRLKDIAQGLCYRDTGNEVPTRTFAFRGPPDLGSDDIRSCTADIFSDNPCDTVGDTMLGEPTAKHLKKIILQRNTGLSQLYETACQNIEKSRLTCH